MQQEHMRPAEKASRKPAGTGKKLPRPRAKGRDGTGVYATYLTAAAALAQPTDGATCKMRHERLEQALSLERFGRYLAWTEGDRNAAIELYGLNTRLSEALYTPLQTLEVVLRNRIHSVLAESHGEAWMHPAAGIVTGPYQQAQVTKVVESLAKEGKDVTAGAVVSSLTFSFWTTMFHKDYETLWQQGMHRIADASAPRGLRRKSFSGPLTRIRLLRNRIAHHEPIVGWDLRKHHERMLEITAWLSPPAATWSREHDRFAQVHRAQAIVSAPGGRA